MVWNIADSVQPTSSTVTLVSCCEMPIDYFASITKKAFDNNFFVSECKYMQQTQYLNIKDIHSAAKFDLLVFL